ncbi:MAG: hypothetical protein ACPLZD_06510 [Candidatus Saccharicenans sp.]
MKIKQVIIALLALSVLTYGQESKSKFSFSIKGGYFAPRSSTFNGQYITAVNTNLNDLNSYLTNFGLSGLVNKMGKMTGGADFGGELEVQASDQLSLALGAEYAFRTLTAALSSSGTVNLVSYSATEVGKTSLAVAPLTVTFRLNLPVTVARIYIGGGVGYYLGRVTEVENWTWTQGDDTVDTGTRKTVATGSAVIPHANLGAEYGLSDRVSVAADIKFPFGSISSFTIKKASDDPNSIGQKLTFVDSNGVQKNFRWELSGPIFGLNLKIKF